MAKANPNAFECDECNNTFKSNDTLVSHTSKYHNKNDNVELLKRRVYELEQIVLSFKERQNQQLQENVLFKPLPQIKIKETSKPKHNESNENDMDTDPIPPQIPPH